MEDKPLYFPLLYRLDKTDSYLIWYTHDIDGVVVSSTGKILAFQELSRLRVYAERFSLKLEEEPSFHDLDTVKNWLENPTKNTVNCERFLSAWNLFCGAASSVNDVYFERNCRKLTKIYDKLFWGNNLPSVTPPGKHYEPIWTDDEVEELRKVLENGLNMFRQNLLNYIASDC